MPSHRQRLLEIACKFGSNFADGILWGFSGVFRICKKTQVYFVSDKKGKIHSFRPVMVGYLTYFGTRLSCNPQFGQAKRRKKQKLVLLFGSCRKRSFPCGSLQEAPFIGYNMTQRCRQTELVCFHSFFSGGCTYTFLVPST